MNLRGVVTVTVCVVLLSSAALSTAQADDTPASPLDVPADAGIPQSGRSAAAEYAKAHPNSAPAGSNNFSCVPTPEHPEPVVLAHGTDASAYTDWAALSPLLAADGYCVFALNYGGAPGADTYGTEDIVDSAAAFGRVVDRVRESTGAAKVDVVGYSQGANVTRYYVNKLGGARFVDQWVGLASPSYGGVMYGLAPMMQALPGGPEAVTEITSVAVGQQMQGSPFMTELNAGGDTVPGVSYTTVSSRYDEMIQPYTNMALRGDGAVNVVIQDLCPQDGSGHFRAPYDPFALDLVRTALDPNAIPVARCEFVPIGADIPDVIVDSNF
ncbi:esterase/lipase family protein [Rhodococcus tibetensis]|uniref:Alpha/beta fold hydrolase n=1 Tax=Rhodococcus tibetensis TaxID=2965064 RepID=A0ABT1Q8J0_9NOCA|nr:alpha/beta fold hydrolase [Rhodococcus sp. FXJ9.536]MCQ4118562.1 alpha/beta fold hydrolase [Rhodococcus sp. FXJ9.536]